MLEIEEEIMGELSPTLYCGSSWACEDGDRDDLSEVLVSNCVFVYLKGASYHVPWLVAL